MTTLYRIGSWNETRTYPVQTYQFVCQEWKLYTGVRAGFSQGREGFLELGCFDKHFLYDTLKKALQFFFLNTLKIAFWIRA